MDSNWDHFTIVLIESGTDFDILSLIIMAWFLQEKWFSCWQQKAKYLWCEVIHASTFQKGDSRNAQYKYFCFKLNLFLAHFQIFHVAMEYMIFQHQAFHSHPGTSVVGCPLDFHPAIFYNCNGSDTLSFFLNSSLDTFQPGDLSSSFTFTLSYMQMSIWFSWQNNRIGCQLLLQGSYLSFLCWLT